MIHRTALLSIALLTIGGGSCQAGQYVRDFDQPDNTHNNSDLRGNETSQVAPPFGGPGGTATNPKPINKSQLFWADFNWQPDTTEAAAPFTTRCFVDLTGAATATASGPPYATGRAMLTLSLSGSNISRADGSTLQRYAFASSYGVNFSNTPDGTRILNFPGGPGGAEKTSSASRRPWG